MIELPTISDAEYQVMKIVWAGAPISTNEVVERLEKVTSWKPKTIQTFLTRLVKKGVLRYEKNSRVFVYTPVVDETEYLEQASDTFLSRFYNGALSSMIVSYVNQDKLSDEDLQRLKVVLEDKLSKGR
ncbi:transcriptional regulator [Clostridia bacterium]|nr:transcriptional regulator [Clostridia bacterium]GHV41861.1 transcriptional regulator [Clostridia bacterium]